MAEKIRILNLLHINDLQIKKSLKIYQKNTQFFAFSADENITNDFMSTDESKFQKVLQFLQEKEDHIIMIGTSLPDIAISARGLTNKHKKELKMHANYIYNHCLIPILEILEEKTP